MLVYLRLVAVRAMMPQRWAFLGCWQSICFCRLSQMVARFVLRSSGGYRVTPVMAARFFESMGCIHCLHMLRQLP